MHIEIKKFEHGYNIIDQEAKNICFDLIKNNLNCFHRLQFIVSELNKGSITHTEKVGLHMNDPNADPIYMVFHNLVDKLPHNESICTNELRL